MEFSTYKAILQPPHMESNSAQGFLYGFLVGQSFIILVAAVFIRFFLFSTSQRTSRPKPTRNKGLAGNLSLPEPVTDSSLLESTQDGSVRASSSNLLGKTNSTESQLARLISNAFLNETYRQPESLDWFNVLLAQIINQYRSDARVNGRLVNWLNSVLNDVKKPDVLDDIKITEINIGEDFPIFSNCRIHRRGPGPNAANGMNSTDIEHLSNVLPGEKQDDEFVAEMDVDLSDTITLGIETRLMLGQPRWFNTVMLVSLTVSIIRFSARMSVRIAKVIDKDEKVGTKDEHSDDQRDKKDTKIVLCLSFKPDFTLEFAVRSLLGARSRLQDMPRIGHIIEGILRKWFVDHFVEPCCREIVIFKYSVDELSDLSGTHEEPYEQHPEIIISQ